MYLVFVLAITSVIALTSGQLVVIPGTGGTSLSRRRSILDPLDALRHVGDPLLPRYRSCLRTGCRRNEVCVTRRHNVCHRGLPWRVRRNCQCYPGCLLESGDHLGRSSLLGTSLSHVPHTHGEFVPDGCTFLIGCRRVCTCHLNHFDCQRLRRPRRRRCRRRRRLDRLQGILADDIQSQCYAHYPHDDHGHPLGDRISIDPIRRSRNPRLGLNGLGSVIRDIVTGK